CQSYSSETLQPCVLFVNLWTRKRIHHISIIILDIGYSHLSSSSLQVYINFTEKGSLCFMFCAVHYLFSLISTNFTKKVCNLVSQIFALDFIQIIVVNFLKNIQCTITFQGNLCCCMSCISVSFFVC